MIADIVIEGRIICTARRLIVVFVIQIETALSPALASNERNVIRFSSIQANEKKSIIIFGNPDPALQLFE